MIEQHNSNWGGKRPNAGRKRQYVRTPVKFYIERSQREPLTPESDLSICIAETEVDENDTRTGLVIGDIWYGRDEALAIAGFIERYHPWLETGIE